MILAGDFRKGITVEIDGQVWSIADFQHVKPGKGAAFVRTRLKNVMTGAVLERTFSPTDKYPTAHIETREMQYLYTDGDLYYFMDNESYEQLALNHEQVEDAIDFGSSWKLIGGISLRDASAERNKRVDALISRELLK